MGFNSEVLVSPSKGKTLKGACRSTELFSTKKRWVSSLLPVEG